MKAHLDRNEKDQIRRDLRQKYAAVARNPEKSFRYPTGSMGLAGLDYDKSDVEALPESVRETFCGVGNPFSLGELEAGSRVLDIGCGTGVDTLIAGLRVGAHGRAVGVDLTAAMVASAEKNRRRTGLSTALFCQADAERLPFGAERFQTILSNGALNLVPDKETAAAEAFRVLKRGGRLMVADQVWTGSMPASKAEMIESWHQ